MTSGWLSLRFSFRPIYNNYYYYIISYYSFFTVEVGYLVYFFFLFRDVAILGLSIRAASRVLYVLFYNLKLSYFLFFFSCAAVSVRFTFMLTFNSTWYAAFSSLVYVFIICASLSLWLWLICHEPDMLDCYLWNLSCVPAYNFLEVLVII